MTIEMLQAKIHRATVTDANLNYVGSITIDPLILEACEILVGQKVDVLDINNANRFSTYVISGKKGSGDICLNGAAARLVAVGDKVIIAAYASYNAQELKTYKPNIALVDEQNKITKILHEIGDGNV